MGGTDAGAAAVARVARGDARRAAGRDGGPHRGVLFAVRVPPDAIKKVWTPKWVKADSVPAESVILQDDIDGWSRILI